MTEKTEKKVVESKTYTALKVFMHENKKITDGQAITLNHRQAANLLAGGFISPVSTTKAEKSTAKTDK